MIDNPQSPHIDVASANSAGPTTPPGMTPALRATLEWESETPLALDRPYLLEHDSQRVCAAVSRVVCRPDPQTLEKGQEGELRLGEAATVDIETHRPLFSNPGRQGCAAGSFTLIDPASGQTLATGTIEGAAEVRQPRPRRQAGGHAGLTVWFTGLSSSGKTTLSQAVCDRLRAMGCRVEPLDGDAVRKNLCRGLGFSKEDRDENIRRIGFAAALLTRNGVVAVVSVISPYRAVRDEARARTGNFVEVYANAPLEVCEQRDVKGLYRKARAGQLPGFTGIDDPYEPPLNPEVECRTDRESVTESAGKVLCYVLPRLWRRNDGSTA